MEDAEYMAQIRRLATGAKYVTSVCVGSLILGAAGLLRGKRAACHWASRDFLEAYGAIPDPARVVRDGNVLTGAGVTAGIDFALTLAAELAGDDVAEAIQLAIEYAPAPPFDSGRPETARAEVLALAEKQFSPLREARRLVVRRTAALLAAE
jgi:transcriptional regulator GlxA family with amidase domain